MSRKASTTPPCGASAPSRALPTRRPHYHFENKAGLLAAILEFLDWEVWRPGRMRLQEAVRRDASLRELIIQGLWPFKMTVFEFPWGGDAQSFMFQLATSTDNRNRDALAAIRDPHLKLLKRALKRRLPQLPGPEFEQRWLFFQTEAFAGQWVRAALFRHTERRARP